MNIKEFHDNTKELSAKPFFKTTEGNVTALQILENGLLKEHVTKVPAILVCIAGTVIFENEQKYKLTLSNGDYVNIEPMVKHWVRGIKDSQLLLIK